jgi:glutamate racemase
LTRSRTIDPIGIFDSGVGGLTVANAIHKLLPNERLIYFGDTAHLPYGDKSADAIRHFSIAISQHLLDQGCKAVVVACNSASTAAYTELKSFLKGKAILVEVVQPLVNHVYKMRPEKVGIIATNATIKSGVYQSAIHYALPHSTIFDKATPLIVPMIEEGIVKGEISEAILKNYLNVKEFQELDVLLLACTHYPLVHHAIQKQLPNVEVIDSTQVTAQALQDALSKRSLLATKPSDVPNAFYVSDFTATFETNAKLFFGEGVHLVEKNIW